MGMYSILSIFPIALILFTDEIKVMAKKTQMRRPIDGIEFRLDRGAADPERQCS